MEKKHLVQIQFNHEMFERLQHAARLEDRAVANYVKNLINRELEKREVKPNADI